MHQRTRLAGRKWYTQGMEMLIPAVSSRNQAVRYRVVLSDVGDECDCPDFYWRHVNAGNAHHRCKHVAAARQLLVEGIPYHRPRHARGRPHRAHPSR